MPQVCPVYLFFPKFYACYDLLLIFSRFFVISARTVLYSISSVLTICIPPRLLWNVVVGERSEQRRMQKKKKKKASVSLCPMVGWGTPLSFILRVGGVMWRVAAAVSYAVVVRRGSSCCLFFYCFGYIFCVTFCFNEMIFCFQGQDLRLRSG